MYLKKGFYILIAILISIGFSSCLNDDDDDDYFISKDAQLVYLELSKGSTSILNDVIFTIDQSVGAIYNHDSLPYLTDIDINAMFVYRTGSGRTGNMKVDFGNDSTAWVESGKDSVAVSKIQNLTIYAPDGINVKTYKFNLNVHKVDPDSMQYELWTNTEFAIEAEKRKTIALNDVYFTYIENEELEVYQSSDDLKTWTKQTLTGLPEAVFVRDLYVLNNKLYTAKDSKLYFSENGLDWSEQETDYPVVSVLGYLNTDKNNGLVLGFDKDDTVVSGLITETGECQYGSKLPEEMIFSALITVPGKGITTIESLNKVWFSNDGLNWVKFENPERSFPEITGGTAFYYDNKVYFIGGRETESGEYSKKVYYSRDSGLTWEELKEKTYAPKEFVLRENASVVLDKAGEYFYIVGGKNTFVNTVVLNDIWRVTMNSVTFQIK